MRGRGSRVALPWTPENLDLTMNLSSIRAKVGVSILDSLVGRERRQQGRPPGRGGRRPAYFKRYLGKQFRDAYPLGLGGPMPDGDELYNLVSSKGRGLYYKNEKVTALFDAGRSTMGPAKRRRIYGDVARTMVEDATWVPLHEAILK